MRLADLIPATGMEWMDTDGPYADIVLSTRVRLARNLQQYHFGLRAGNTDREAVLAAARDAAARVNLLGNGLVLPMSTLSSADRRLLLERHLVSKDLIGDAGEDPPSHSALFLSRAEPVGLMVNEEDHLRLQSLLGGFRLQEAWTKVDRLDEELAECLRYAFHAEFGYLTSCPTNVGTGLRASVLVHLPALVLTQEIAKVLQGISQVGLTFRGLYGEGSEVVGNFFQISNQTTLGKSEEDLVDQLHKIVQTVIRYERQAREILLRDATSVISDKVWRAYGLLRYARSISFEEGMNLLSGIRLGVGLKLLQQPSVYTLNQIMVFSQAAHLEQMAGKVLSSTEADSYRASYVRQALAQDEAPASPEGGSDAAP